MDVVVGVGGWEHECCGDAIERNQVVTWRCISESRPEGPQLIESHHGGLSVPADVRVRGRVCEIQVVEPDGAARAILRVPSGLALRGMDEHDDGHLEDPWTGDVVSSTGSEFLVTIRTSRS